MRASATGRPRSVLLVLGLLAALGMPLTGPAPAGAQAAASLELTPAKAVTEVNRPIRYTAQLVDANGRRDVTSRTTLDFGLAPCAEDKTAPGQVSCRDNGDFTVTGSYGHPKIRSEPAVLRVVNGREAPAFTKSPASSPPNGEVTVEGSTGSCGQTGTLSSDRLKVDQQVASAFTATFKIPPGTFVGPHPLLLSVACDKETQRATVDVTVDNQPPDAVDDRGTATPGERVPIPVTSNDTDPDGDDGYATKLEVDPPTVGTAEVQGQAVVYTAGTGFLDRDQFTYRNCDIVNARGGKDCDTATVIVTEPDPTPVNDPDEITEEETTVSILVTRNDTSPDPARLRVRTGPEHGTAVVQARPRDGHIEYRPKKGFTGKDSFTYDYCEGVVGPNVVAPTACPFAVVTVDVRPRVPPAIRTVHPNPTPPNREVVVRGTTGSCPEGTLVLHIPPRGSEVPVPVAADPSGAFTGEVEVPAGTFVGSYMLELRVDCDQQVQTTEAKLQVDNRAPDAVDDPAKTDQDTPVTIPVTENDTDPDGDDGYQTSLQAAKPASGTTEVLTRDRIRYTPDQGFAGVDPFTYTLCEIVDANGRKDCDTATVIVTVIGPGEPEPVDDPDQTTLRDQAVSILVTGNDIRPDPERLRVRTNPKEGTATVQQRPRDGHILYTPRAGFTGTDSFTYEYCRSVVDVTTRAACPFATVTVDVRPPPTSPAIETVTLNPTPPNREVVVGGTTGSCNQAGTLTLRIPRTTALPVPVRGGQNGAFEARLRVPGGTTPGTYPLELRVRCDREVQTAEAKLEVANRPPTAVDDTATTSRDTPVTIDATGNDSDPDGDDGYQTSVTAEAAKDGKAQVQAGNRIRYTPAAGFVGVDRFRYHVCDVVDAGGATDCGGATVTVTVGTPPPKAVDDQASTVRDRPVRVDVTKNDVDPDVARLRVLPPDRPGAKAEEQPDGIVGYTPEPGFTGTDRFRYDYCGGSADVNAAAQGACSSATVTVTVTRPDPVPVDDPDATTLQGQPVVIDVMGNDRDPDAARLRVKPRPAPKGTADRLPDGTIRYTPASGRTGMDSFQYDYCGGSGDPGVTGRQAACPSATVTVMVTARPVISSVRPRSTPPGRPVEVGGNTGSCGRNGTLTLQGTGAAAKVTAAQDGGFSARLPVPNGTFPRTYTLELRVDCKGQVQRAEGSLTVTNQAPVATDDTATTTRDHPVGVDVTANDRDPDDPDGYRTLVLPSSPSAHGRTEAQPDNRVLYIPDSGFVGQDRFRYSICDDVLNAKGRADCGTATVTVTVTDTPVISSVAPGSTPPGRPVEVIGNTGTCNRSGTLIFHGTADLPMDIAADQNGRFTTGFTVPAGTFPGRYRLELRVDCHGRQQLARAGLTVVNQPPAPVDDRASTLLDTPVDVEVTGNDRDPDDPDGYATLVLVSTQPSHGTAEVQPDNRVRYTPARGFFGQDRFGYSLCDDVLNASGTADCGTATVTVAVDPRACVPPAGASPPLHVDPVKGSGGTKLRITARVDRGLATCPLRLLLGGTPLGPDVRVGPDGGVAAERGVPSDVRPGPSPVRLATLTAQTVAETPFQVVPGPGPSGLRLPLRLLLGAAALLAGALARAGFRRWRGSREGRKVAELPDDFRAEPHTRPVEVAVEPERDNTRTFSVRLEPHPDPGNQTLREVTR